MYNVPQEADIVAVPCKAASTIEVARLNRLASNFRHDVALATKILVTQTQEVVDDKGFIAVADSIEVDIEIVVAEEEKTDPGLERVDRNDEEDPDNPSLLSGVGVVAEILVDLVTCYQDSSPGAGTGNTLAFKTYYKPDNGNVSLSYLRQTARRLWSHKCDLW